MCLLLFLLFGITIAEKTYIDNGTPPSPISSTELAIDYSNDTEVNYTTNDTNTNDTDIPEVKDISAEIEDLNSVNKNSSDDLDLSFIFKTILLPNNNNETITTVQEFIQKIISLLHQEITYKCAFVETPHCKIVDNMVYAIISGACMCIFFILIYTIHSLYKLLSVYNNYKEAKRVFLDLETKI